MLKFFFKFLISIICLLIIVALFNIKKIKRLNAVNHLFDEGNIIENFQGMEKVFDVSKLEASPNPLQLKEQLNYELPKTFKYKDREEDIAAYLKHTRNEGLLIIHKDTIIYEKYSNGLTKKKQHISWSMSKSFVSALIGIYVEKDMIDLNTSISDYLPEFIGSGYEGVSVKDVLQMSSGVGFNEDYADFNSDINRFGRAFALGTSLRSFALSLKKDKKPGTYNRYVSIDTQMLGLLLKEVTKKPITQLLKEHIWDPIGMESDAYWIVDNEDMEVVLGGLNATLRDYAKLGLLYLNQGSLNGNRILSKDWIEKSITPDAPHLMPNQTDLSTNHFGYGYQWWTPQFPKNDFFAVGIYNQFVYVNKEKELVIALLSGNHHFKSDTELYKDKHINMLQQIAEQFKQN